MWQVLQLTEESEQELVHSAVSNELRKSESKDENIALAAHNMNLS